MLADLRLQQQEFDWLLNEEVNDILSQLHDIVLVSQVRSLASAADCLLQECSRRFPVQLDPKIQSLVHNEDLKLAASGAHNDHLKISTKLSGDSLTETVSLPLLPSVRLRQLRPASCFLSASARESRT